MPLLKRLVETPLYIDIRKGALEDLTQVLADQRVSANGHIALVMSEGGSKKFSEKLKKIAPNAKVYISPGNSLNDAIVAMKIPKNKLPFYLLDSFPTYWNRNYG